MFLSEAVVLVRPSSLQSCPCPAGVFSLNVPVEALFFVGNQLIATSHAGKVGVWNAVTKHWQVSGDEGAGVWCSVLSGWILSVVSVQNQEVVPISSYDTAGSFLILGCNNGSIYYIGNDHGVADRRSGT